jgi:ADP-ribose pyrophosphatase
MRLVKLSARYRERFQRATLHYQGRAVGFRCDQIRLPDGRPGQREYLTHPGAVGVLAFENPNRLLLVKQFRYPVGEFTYEIPAGKLAKGENPILCVHRELEEEAGVRARRVRPLLRFWPTAAFSDEVIHLYVATGLVITRADPDDDEFLEIVRVSPRQVEAMIRRGTIRDSKTIIAYWSWKASVAGRAGRASVRGRSSVIP